MLYLIDEQKAEGLMKKKIYIRIALALGFIALILYLRTLPAKEYSSFAYLKSHLMNIKSYVDTHYATSVALYIFLCFLVVVASLPLVAALTIVGGALFGIFKGILFVNIGATAGAVVSFYIYRYFLADAVEYMYPKQLASFNRSMEKYGSLFLLVIHFVAVIPLFLINALAAISNVSLATFSWTSSLGIIPASFIFAFAGSQLNSITSVEDILSPWVIAAFLLLVTLALSPAIYNYFKKSNVENV